MPIERIKRVQDFILHNLDKELTLDILSEVANLSKFHFHRVFLVHTGMTLFKFIQMSRLKKAAYQLAFNKDMQIIDIALDVGFESPEAFARAFKKMLTQTPSQFRKKPNWDFRYNKFQFQNLNGVERMDVRIVDFPETKIALIEHRGSPNKILETAGQFIKWRKETGLSPIKTSKTFGIPYSDPNVTPEDDFHFDVCGSINDDVPENDYKVKTGSIPGGRCAVVQHIGSLDNISESVYYLYKNWLPTSGEELRDFPCYFQYLNLLIDVDECDLITDIYLPLK